MKSRLHHAVVLTVLVTVVLAIATPAVGMDTTPSPAIETPAEVAPTEDVSTTRLETNLAGGSMSGPELAVVDTTVEDHQSLARAAREAGIEVVNVSSAAELTAALDGRSNLAAVHILSHGAVGTVQIGSDTIRAETLDQYSDLTAALDSSLAVDGDLLLYGCLVARDGSGDEFVTAIADATGGDVAASEDLTGNEDAGGDWELEAEAGVVEARAVAQAVGFDGVLTTATFDFEDGLSGFNTGSGTAQDQEPSGTLKITAADNNVRRASNLGGVISGTESGATDYAVAFESELTFELVEDKTFDLNQITLGEFSGSLETLEIKGGEQTASITLPASSTQTYSPSIQDVSSFTLTPVDGQMAISFDDITFNDIQTPNTAPTLDLDADTTSGNGVTTAFSEATDQGTGAGNGVAVAPNAVFEDSEGTVDQLTLTLDNNQGDTGEQLFLAAGDLQGAVTGAGSGNTLTLVRNGSTETDLRDTLRNIRFQNGDDDPTTGTDRTITVDITDNAALTATDADTATVTVSGTNDAPTLSATGSSPTFTEGGGAAGLYSDTSAGVVESGQTVAGFEFTVTNVVDGADEEIALDGSTISLTDGNAGTTIDNSMSYSVSVSGSTATVTVSGFSVTPTSFENSINAMSYRNAGDDPDTSNRVVTLTEITDSGGTTNGGDADTTVSIGSTVSFVAVNDAPSITIGGDQSVGNTTDGQTVADFATGFDPVESGQSISDFTVTNDDNGLFTAQPDIDNAGDLTYTPADGVSGTATVSVQVVDDGGTANGGENTSATGTFDITVDNTDPGFSSGSSPSVTEGTTGTVIDVAAGDDGTTSPDTNVDYSLGSPVGDDAAFSIVTADGTLSLDSARDFENPTDSDGNNDYELTVTATDDGGNTAEQSITVSITDVNEAPTLDTNTGLTVLEGSATNTITDTNLTASDPEQAPGSITYDVTSGVSSGTLSVGGTPVGTGTFTQADINAGELTYSHDDSETTSDSFTVDLKDGAGGTLAGQTVTITVTGVNDAPTLSVTAGDATFTEDGGPATVFSGASVDTIETDQQLSTLTIQVSNVTDGSAEILTVDGSDVALTDGTSLTTADNSLSATVSRTGETATVTVSGSISTGTANTIIDALGYTNGDDPTTSDPRTITLTELTDDGGTANGGSNTTSLSESADVSITAVNDAPTLSTDVRSLNAVTEDDTDNAGTAVTTVLGSAGTTGDAEGDTLGGALTAVDDTDGTWEFSTDGGTTWQTVSGSSPTTSNALLLAATDRLRFVPDGNFSGTAGGSVTVRAWDQTTGTNGTNVDTTTNGGTTAYSTNTASVEVSVTPVNDAPTASSLSSTAVDQSGGTDAVVGSLSATDVDNASHTFSLVSGSGDTNNSLFNIDSGDLRANDASVLAEDTYSVRIEADDGGGGTYNRSFTISVVDDVAPTLTGSDPADDSTDHVPGEDITLTFDEPISFGDGQITLRENNSGFSNAETFDVSSDIGNADGNVSISGSQLTINPTSDLVADTEYAVQIDAMAIDDTATTPNAFVGIGTDDGLNFTTADTKPSFAQATSGTVSVSVTEDDSLDLTSALEVSDISVSDTLTWSVESPPDNGTVTGLDGESITFSSGTTHTLSSGPTYIPDSEFAGPTAADDSFDVRVTDGDAYMASATVEIDIQQVNDAPTVTLGGNQTVNGTTSQQTVANFASFAPGGGSDEAGQSVDDYTVTVASDPEGVISAVDINDDGNLTYTANDSVEGTATVAVAVADDGGTANGGTNTSSTESFEITVDTRAPTVDSASTTARTLTVTMDEPLSEAAVNTPPGTNFTVTADGSRIGVDDVTVNGSIISLGLSDRISFGDAVTVNYTQGTNSIEDLATNQLSTFTDQSVANTVRRPDRNRGGGGGGGGRSSEETGSTVTVEPEPSTEDDSEADSASGDSEPAADTDSKSVSVRGARQGQRVRIDLSEPDTEDDSEADSTDSETGGDSEDGDDTDSSDSDRSDSGEAAESSQQRPRNVVAEGLDIQFAEDGDYDLTVRTRDADTSGATDSVSTDTSDSGSASQPDLSTNSLDDEGRRFARETRQRPVGFIEVDTEFEEDAVETATHRFRVRKSYLESTGASVESVRLYRDEISQWRELETSRVGETEEYYFFEAETPGFSVFVIGTTAPVFEPTGQQLVEFNESTGAVEATVSVENIGSESGIFDAVLTADGVSIGAADVSIPPGERVEVTVTGVVEGSDSVRLSLAGQSLGAVTPTRPTTENSEFGLFGVLVGVIVVAVGVLLWRRRPTDESKP